MQARCAFGYYTLAYNPVFKDSKRLAESKLNTDAAITG